MDRTGLRPTTDGSEGSDEIANDYMIATYYKQQASAHPEMTQPAPEPPKTTHGKWSKNTFKTVLPINFRYYNVDHTEFQSPFEYADKYGNITNPPEAKQSSLFGGLTESIATSVFFKKFENNIKNNIKSFKSVLTNDVADIAKNNTDELFGFGGPFIDFASQIVDGKEVDEALAMTGFYLAVEWAFVAAVTAILPTSISFFAIIIGTAIAVFINNIIDNYMNPYLVR